MKCGKKDCLVCGRPPYDMHDYPVEQAMHKNRIIADLRKELAKARRLNRRMVYKYILKGWDVKHLVDGSPSLHEIVPRCRTTIKRLTALQAKRKERLLREMRPEDLRALGLTPPPKKEGVKENNPYNICKHCHRVRDAHFGVILFCDQTGNLDKYSPA